MGRGEALEHGDAAIPFGVVPSGHAAVDVVGEGEVAALGGQPLGGVVGFLRGGGETAGEPSGLDGPADTFADEGGGLAAGVTDGEKAGAGELGGDAFGGDEAVVVFDGLGSAEVDAVVGRFGDQAVEVRQGMVGRVAGGSVVEADADADAMVAPGEDPGVAGGGDAAADEEEHVALVAVGGVEIVFRADAEAAEAGVEEDGAVAGGVDGGRGLPGDGLVEGVAAGGSGDAAAGFEKAGDGGGETELGTGGDGLFGEVLVEAADVEDAEVGLVVGEDGFSGGGEEAEAADGMREAVGDVEGAEFAEEAAAGGADGSADFLILFDEEDGTAARGGGMGGGEAGGSSTGDQDIKRFHTLV